MFVIAIAAIFLGMIVLGVIASAFCKEKLVKTILVVGCVLEVITIELMPVIDANATYNETLRANLVSVDTKTKTEGSSTFLVADTGEEDVYTFFYETENGGVKKGKVNSKNVIVFETNETEPSIIRYEESFAGYTLSNLMTLEGNRPAEFNNDSSEENDVRYEIYVPEGTIVQKFQLE